MAEDLKQVIARIKSKQNSQQSNKVEKPIIAKKEEIPISNEENEEFEEEDGEMPINEEKPAVISQEQATEGKKQAQQQIMLLQDNGIYRLQMLNQLQEINKALVVIAGILADFPNGKLTA